MAGRGLPSGGSSTGSESRPKSAALTPGSDRHVKDNPGEMLLPVVTARDLRLARPCARVRWEKDVAKGMVGMRYEGPHYGE
jgi:hypothetical protein